MTGTGGSGMGAIAKLNYFAGGAYMKKGSLIVCFVLLIPAAALAQNKTLYDISQDTVTLIEKYAVCAAGDSACTQDDALALQADAENSLLDLEILLRSGSAQDMIISVDQARTLSERVNAVRGRLTHIEFFDALCNKSILRMMKALGYTGVVLGLMLYFLGGWGYVIVAFALIPVLIICMAFVLGNFLLMAPCLFWWL